jgi:hypothetical protein
LADVLSRFCLQRREFAFRAVVRTVGMHRALLLLLLLLLLGLACRLVRRHGVCVERLPWPI